MSADELTAITIRMPATLRDKIKTQAALEERSESGFIRFVLGKVLAMTESETEVPEEEEQP